jgi:hypothetical protein
MELGLGSPEAQIDGSVGIAQPHFISHPKAVCTNVPAKIPRGERTYVYDRQLALGGNTMLSIETIQRFSHLEGNHHLHYLAPSMLYSIQYTV